MLYFQVDVWVYCQLWRAIDFDKPRLQSGVKHNVKTIELVAVACGLLGVRAPRNGLGQRDKSQSYDFLDFHKNFVVVNV